MIDPDFFAVALAQRACRWFTDDPVPDADLERMLEAATHAPSAGNAQPWAFVVVRDADRRARIGRLAQRLWERGGRQHSEGRVAPAIVDDLDRSLAVGFGGAPVLVVVAAESGAVEEAALASSVLPAVQNLLLAAGALGYGSSLTTLATMAPEPLRDAVDLPGDLLPVAVVPLGRPARALGPPRRSPVRDKAHLDRWGQPFPPPT